MLKAETNRKIANLDIRKIDQNDFCAKQIYYNRNEFIKNSDGKKKINTNSESKETFKTTKKQRDTFIKIKNKKLKELNLELNNILINMPSSAVGSLQFLDEQPGEYNQELVESNLDDKYPENQIHQAKITFYESLFRRDSNLDELKSFKKVRNELLSDLSKIKILNAPKIEKSKNTLMINRHISLRNLSDFQKKHNSSNSKQLEVPYTNNEPTYKQNDSEFSEFLHSNALLIKILSRLNDKTISSETQEKNISNLNRYKLRSVLKEKNQLIKESNLLDVKMKRNSNEFSSLYSGVCDHKNKIKYSSKAKDNMSLLKKYEYDSNLKSALKYTKLFDKPKESVSFGSIKIKFPNLKSPSSSLVLPKRSFSITNDDDNYDFYLPKLVDLDNKSKR